MIAADGAEEFAPPFETLMPPHQAAPAVFNSPHSGRIYPRRFLAMSRLDPLALRRSEDCYIDDLFAPCVALGAPLLRAHFPRAYLDVNREAYELDAGMFADSLPPYVNSGSVRVAGGLGTIPRIVSEHEEIYRWALPWAEAEARINELYHPYHQALGKLVEETFRVFGTAVLVDCHSMPSTAATGAPRTMRRADVILGDRFGATAGGTITGYLEHAFAGAGLSVVRNTPYAGGFITQAYGRPHLGFHAVQIEINRALYVDERTLEKSSGFGPLRQTLDHVLSDFLAVLPDLAAPRRAAAE